MYRVLVLRRPWDRFPGLESRVRTKLDKALGRLTLLLPLKERQEGCSEQVRELHRQVLRSFVDKGRILTREEMGQYVSDLEEAVEVLKGYDMVVFSAQGEPVGAYPFTMETREHAVEVNGHRVHAMCALDAVSVGPMFGMETQVDSRCRVTGEPVCIRQAGTRVLNPDAAAGVHIGILWGAGNASACCADSLCMEMMFLRDSEVARAWLAEDPDGREIFTLQEAIEFGHRFFSPLVS